MPAPEQIARAEIDRLLTLAGWVLQDRDQFDRNAAPGVAVREFPFPAGFCDYLLFVDGKAAGVIEAKKAGLTLSGVADQSAKYMLQVPEHLARLDELLVYDYESTGDETLFRNLRDCRVEAVHGLEKSLANGDPRARRSFAASTRTSTRRSRRSAWCTRTWTEAALENFRNVSAELGEESS